jgi:regulator of sigma E protease
MSGFFGIVAGVVIVILLFSLAIFMHEFGHFLAARWVGMVVDTFSLGFGPAIWKRKINGVLYKICVVPFGGYVALPQLDPSGMENIQGENAPDEKNKEVAKEAKEPEKPRDLPDAAPWKRIVVAIAGPFGNVVLAVILAWIIYLAPHNSGGMGTQIGTVEKDVPAWQAGLRPGQVIERVNGERIATWYDFMVECHLAGDLKRGVSLTIRDVDGKQRDVSVPVSTNMFVEVNAVEGVMPKSLCRISDVRSNSVAEAAGIHAEDQLRSVNGVAVVSAQQFVNYMEANGIKPVKLVLVRDEKPLEMTITPVMNTEIGRPVIGVILGDAFNEVPMWMQYTNPWRQIGSDASQVFRILRALFMPKNAGESKRAAQSVGGPLFIIVTLWHAVMSGMLNSLGLLRLISVNLAIINLLPIPVLDGGHIVFALWEMITRRKPHPKVVSALVNFFAVLLIGMMLLLVGRDALRISRMHHKDKVGAAVSTNAAPAAAHAPVKSADTTATPEAAKP